MKLGRLGVWASTELMTAAEAAAFARRIEAWGYAALWLPEALGRNVLVHAAWLLANTETLIIATGIANIYARDATAMASARQTLAEQSGGRFLLGMGVSHAPLVEDVRGHSYVKPLTKMRDYLDAMARVHSIAPPPPEPPPTVIAALGPKMMALAGERADGAHPYLVTPAHTAEARRVLGPGKLLCPDQKLVLDTDAATARATARASLVPYLGLANYRKNFGRLGFAEEEFENGGSDRLIDAMVAWGDEGTLRARIDQHFAAGADHVCIQALHPDGMAARYPNERLLALLAPNGRA